MGDGAEALSPFVSLCRPVLASAGPGHLTQLTYNARDGKLVAIYLAHQTATATQITSLEIVE